MRKLKLMLMQILLLKVALHNQRSFYQDFWFFSFSYSLYIHLYLIILEIWYNFNIFLIYLSGDNDMNKKFSSGLAVILPNKRVNLFVIFIILLGIVSGTLFLLALNETDKELVVNQITNFMTNINDNNINNFNAFKNGIVENLIFVILIWVLGMSIIGIIFNIFAVYLKGFMVGFTLSSFFLVYKFKGLLAGSIYLIPSGIIYIIISLILGVYSVMLTAYLWKVIFLKDKSNSVSRFLKKYFLILIICIILVLVSSLCEAYVIPSLLKLAIKVFI